MNICAVIVAYRTPQEMNKLLSSLEDQSHLVDGLIVIDNSENEIFINEDRDIFSACKNFSTKKFIASSRNFGSAGGFEMGMKEAFSMGFDWIWLLDQDGVISSSCLEKLLDSGKRGILCPVIRALHADYVLPDFRCKLNLFGAIVPLRVSSGLPREIDLAGTHGILIHKDVIKSVGYYDGKRFFVGREDLDYCFRAKRAKCEIWLIPEAVAYHPDLSKKSGFSPAVVFFRKLHHCFSRFMPQFLGFSLKQNEERRKQMIWFHLDRLNRYQYVFAIVYSVPIVVVLRLLGVGLNLKETLKLYFQRI